MNSAQIRILEPLISHLALVVGKLCYLKNSAFFSKNITGRVFLYFCFFLYFYFMFVLYFLIKLRNINKYVVCCQRKNQA